MTAEKCIISKLKFSNISSSPLLLSFACLVILLVTSCVRFLVKLLKRKLFPSLKDDNLALDPFEFRSFQLIEKVSVTPNARLFRFATCHPKHLVNVPLGKHIYAKAWINGKEVRRPYNPVSKPYQKGYFDIVVKVNPTLWR